MALAAIGFATGGQFKQNIQSLSTHTPSPDIIYLP
jgi:hypothetical protein